MTDDQILAIVPNHFPATLDDDVFDMDGIMSLYTSRFIDFARAIEAQARAAALEEAAQFCEKYGDKALVDFETTKLPYYEGRSDAAESILQAIRALIAAPESKPASAGNQDALDAARYEWWSHNCINHPVMVAKILGPITRRVDLDAAIDAQIAKENGQ